MNTLPIPLGLDMAKKKFDACLLLPQGSHKETFTNDPDGFAKLRAWLGRRTSAKVHAALEATGPYSLPLALFLQAQGCTVSLLNPARPKAFAQARGCRNKTDGIDAQTLAELVAAQRPAPWTPPAPALQRLQELVRRREDILGMLQAEASRREGASPAVLKHIERMIRFFEKELQHLEGLIEEHLDTCPALKEQRQLLCSIKGISRVTAHKLLAELGEVGRFRRARQVAAFAGLTPRLHQSGGHQGQQGRICKIGSPVLRKALYLPAITASRFNPVLKRFAERLKAKGKSKKVIIVAVMRKLLEIAAAVLKTGKPFDPNHAPA